VLLFPTPRLSSTRTELFFAKSSTWLPHEKELLFSPMIRTTLFSPVPCCSVGLMSKLQGAVEEASFVLTEIEGMTLDCVSLLTSHGHHWTKSLTHAGRRVECCGPISHTYFLSKFETLKGLFTSSGDRLFHLNSTLWKLTSQTSPQ
jgi:hypothetical protein